MTLPESMEAVHSKADGPNRGGVLHFGLSTDPANLDPHVSTGTASDYLRQLVYNGLLQYDGSGAIVADLASEFGWAGRRTYKVRLRPKVAFHDGSVMTAEDVVFSFRRMMDKETAATSGQLLAGVKSVEAADATTVVFHLTQPDVAFPFALAAPTSNVVSKRWIESGADTKIQMMGTGPFRFVERIPGVSTTFVRFDEYFEPELPYLNGIVFQPMGDDYARVTALRTATVDMIDYVPATHVGVITRNPRLRFASDRTFGFGFVGFVTSKPPFDDVRVRKAVALSINRRSVLDTALLGHGQPMEGGLMSGSFARYAGQLDGSMPYDPEQARFLLKQAGQEGLALPVVTTSSYSVISRPAQAMLPGLRAAGLKPELTQQEWLTFRASVAAKSFPVHSWGTAPKFGDPASLVDFIGGTGAFAMNLDFQDDRIDELLVQGRRTADPALRDEIYLEAERRALKLVPMAYTVRREQGEAHYHYVKGYQHPSKGAWTAVALRRTWMEKTA
ncbi:ABC transporter substrate-binding protein [Streptomyces sp. NBRC 110028]|uniref:ABC transporter substrate-binding protein n=1 Tax=Streptomyces sp. NBRC 110028 TaxID=1621260 RepID=UPI001F2B3282|nr:ABC transporter substrate-binding protein [Streptomyces sp. NBRC 110028]